MTGVASLLIDTHISVGSVDVPAGDGQGEPHITQVQSLLIDTHISVGSVDVPEGDGQGESHIP